MSAVAAVRRRLRTCRLRRSVPRQAPLLTQILVGSSWHELTKSRSSWSRFAVFMFIASSSHFLIFLRVVSETARFSTPSISVGCARFAPPVLNSSPNARPIASSRSSSVRPGSSSDFLSGVERICSCSKTRAWLLALLPSACTLERVGHGELDVSFELEQLLEERVVPRPRARRAPPGGAACVFLPYLGPKLHFVKLVISISLAHARRPETSAVGAGGARGRRVASAGRGACRGERSRRSRRRCTRSVVPDRHVEQLHRGYVHGVEAVAGVGARVVAEGVRGGGRGDAAGPDLPAAAVDQRRRVARGGGGAGRRRSPARRSRRPTT